jgi:hypothetical protein
MDIPPFPALAVLFLPLSYSNDQSSHHEDYAPVHHIWPI